MIINANLKFLIKVPIPKLKSGLYKYEIDIANLKKFFKSALWLYFKIKFFWISSTGFVFSRIHKTSFYT